MSSPRFGGPPGRFRLADRSVTVGADGVRLADGTLAGSAPVARRGGARPGRLPGCALDAIVHHGHLDPGGRARPRSQRRGGARLRRRPDGADSDLRVVGTSSAVAWTAPGLRSCRGGRDRASRREIRTGRGGRHLVAARATGRAVLGLATGAGRCRCTTAGRPVRSAVDCGSPRRGRSCSSSTSAFPTAIRSSSPGRSSSGPSGRVDFRARGPRVRRRSVRRRRGVPRLQGAIAAGGVDPQLLGVGRHGHIRLPRARIVTRLSHSSQDADAARPGRTTPASSALSTTCRATC